MFVRYVRSERDGADRPGSQPPRRSHLIGPGAASECGGADAHGEVHKTQDEHCPEPWTATRRVHAACLRLVGHHISRPRDAVAIGRRCAGRSGAYSVERAHPELTIAITARRWSILVHGEPTLIRPGAD